MSHSETIDSILADLNEMNCRVWVEDCDLMVRTSKAGITPELKERLKANKEGILTYLSDPNDSGLALSDLNNKFPCLFPTHSQESSSADTVSNHPAHLPLPKASQRESTFPLSYGQQAFWFLYRNAPDSSAYNVTMHWRILSPVDIPVLKVTLQAMVDRHPSLRTTFSERNGVPVQIVHPYQDVSFEQCDVSHETDDDIYQRARASYLRLFNLETGPLFRAHLFSQADDKHVLLITMHHIVNDGWSFWNLMSEFISLYSSLKAGEPPKLEPLHWHYQDYIHWQNELLSGPEGERLWEYWKGQLSDQPPVLDLPADRSRPPMQTGNGSSIIFTLPKALTQKLKTNAKASGTTLYVILVATFQVLLHRYTGQRDIWVGTAAAGRSFDEFKDICGCFFNFVVLRGKLDPEESFSTFLNQMQNTALQALVHQDYPSLLLIERLNPRRDGNRFPLFQVEFNLQQPHEDDDLAAFFLGADENHRVEKGGLSLKPYRMTQQEGQFDLSLDLIDVSGESLSGICRYNSDLFDESRIQRMLEHFENLLEAVIAEPQTNISQLALLAEPEKKQLMVEWNNTSVDFDQKQCLHELFENRAFMHPDVIAVISETEQVSYGEINIRANRLAHRLRKEGVGPEVLVGLFMERSVKMVVGILAILKAGGAYVPLDTEYPAERLAFMVEDADLKVLLCHSSTRNKLPNCKAMTLDVDTQSTSISAQSNTNPDQLAGLNNLAYVIYTSGTTGKPKGCANEHKGILNRILWMQETYQLKPEDAVLQKTPFSFDVSVWEFLWPLMAGARLVMAKPAGHKDPIYLADLINKHKVTVMHFVPSMLSAFLEGIAERQCPSLREVICSGEALTANIQDRFFNTFNARLHNLYGPTEAAIDVSYWQCSKNSSLDIIPIGRPIANMQLYILDSVGNPAPIGVPGELYIGGVGVARGYLNRPELNAEKFISDPFSDQDDARLYRTGDLCRWLSDGNIEYLGRIDTQVKIRGFRIECGEVENVLLSHTGVKQAVVDARGEGAEKKLVAWLVGAPEQEQVCEITEEELRCYLRDALPEWMIPSRFVFVEALPLTPNGKVERKALPSPDASKQNTKTKSAPPGTDLEKSLSGIWCELLKRESIGIHENFFEAGGDSMSMIRLQSKLRDEVGKDVAVAKLFANPTIHTLARYLDGNQEQRTTRSRAGDRRTRQDSMRKKKETRQQRRSNRHAAVKN